MSKFAFEQLDYLLENQDGLLRTEQAVSAGISKSSSSVWPFFSVTLRLTVL